MNLKFKINQTGLDEVVEKSEELIELSKRVQQLRREINAIDIIFDVDNGSDEEKEDFDISDLKIKDPVFAENDETLNIQSTSNETIDEELADTIIALCEEIRESLGSDNASYISALASALYNLVEIYRE